MEDASVDEAVVISYLLGNLPEETMVKVEDRAFSDPEYLRLIEAVEGDLIDAYVHQQLQGAERRQFEERFFASPERRKKVEFARAWAQVSSEAGVASTRAAASERFKDWRSWRDWFDFRGRLPLPMGAAMAAVILLGIISWQAVQSSKLRNRLGELETERKDLQQQEQKLQGSLAAEHERAEQLNEQIRRGSEAGIVTLTLLPGIVRSETARPLLMVPTSAQLAKLEIQLEPRDKYPQFRAELRSRQGDEILTRSHLHERQEKAVRAVVLEIPAEALSSGDYELTLAGMGPKRQWEDIGYYRFSVRKP
jgi:hypothetical protein